MRALEPGQNQVELQADDMLHLGSISGVVIVLSGVLAPIMISSLGYVGNYDFSIQSLLWYFHIGTFGSDFQFLPFYATFSIFPYLVLRMVPAYVTFRYYQGRTSRRRALFGLMIGDLLFLIEGIPFFLFAISFINSYFILPFPFQMLVGFLILWRFPIPEPTKPWESSEETKPWWEKESDDVPVSSDSKNDEDRLW
jgi:hypothetical protein